MATESGHGFIRLFGQAILIPPPPPPPLSIPQEPPVPPHREDDDDADADADDDDEGGMRRKGSRGKRRRNGVQNLLPTHQHCTFEAYDNDSSPQLTTSSILRERRKGMPWNKDEHHMFLLGLEKLGKGDWRGISRSFVTSRTPTQVASHAQKYFLRQCNLNKRTKRRSSLFDMISSSSSSSTSSNDDDHKDNACLGGHASALVSILQ